MDVYVVGSFNDYELKDENKMTFDNLRNKFELKLKLKQGFYNYKYIVADKSKKIIKNLNVGGNFDETENKYSVVVTIEKTGVDMIRLLATLTLLRNSLQTEKIILFLH